MIVWIGSLLTNQDNFNLSVQKKTVCTSPSGRFDLVTGPYKSNTDVKQTSVNRQKRGFLYPLLSYNRINTYNKEKKKIGKWWNLNKPLRALFFIFFVIQQRHSVKNLLVWQRPLGRLITSYSSGFRSNPGEIQPLMFWCSVWKIKTIIIQMKTKTRRTAEMIWCYKYYTTPTGRNFRMSLCPPVYYE